MFCPEGALSWQGQSEALRNNTRDIQNYQQFYAEWLDGNAPALNCVQVGYRKRSTWKALSRPESLTLTITRAPCPPVDRGVRGACSRG
jgi:hypothetical protein